MKNKLQFEDLPQDIIEEIIGHVGTKTIVKLLPESIYPRGLARRIQKNSDILKMALRDSISFLKDLRKERYTIWGERDAAWEGLHAVEAERDAAWAERDAAWAERDAAWAVRNELLSRNTKKEKEIMELKLQVAKLQQEKKQAVVSKRTALKIANDLVKIQQDPKSV
jgi:uncharacterized protein (DUF3084 family)